MKAIEYNLHKHKFFCLSKQVFKLFTSYLNNIKGWSNKIPQSDLSLILIL